MLHILILLILLALFCAAPHIRCGRARKYCGALFAHRGLHDAANGRTENCLGAFEAACQAGYGIELDVRYTRDHVLVVHHDATLARLFGTDARMDQYSFEELKALRSASGEAIPSFDEVLELIDGRTPLVVEIKNGPELAALTRDTVKRLERYPGEYVVESFNPLCLLWLRWHAPQVIRGQLTAGFRRVRREQGLPTALLLSSLALNFLARPDFIAYDASAPAIAPRIQRRLFHTPMFAWTVRTEALCARLREQGDGVIFESILP